MTHDQIEQLERTAMSMVTQGLVDYTKTVVRVFQQDTDLPQDIAEDLTREAMDAMGLPSIKSRLYGKVDYKKSIYVFLPEAHPVALMLDAKAEKPNGSSTATIQMSQTSMRVRMKRRSGEVVDEPGKLSPTIRSGRRSLLVVTIIAKYVYSEQARGRSLHRIILACIPNGKLQAVYNPDETQTIWRAGRNAPSRGEDFRVRLVYDQLSALASWRVKTLELGRLT